jgi:chromosome segregation ATPase
MMWSRFAEALWAVARFLAPERAAYEVIIARYKQALADERENSEAREKELKEDIAALKRSEARCQAQLSDARHDITQLQQQVWELSAVINAIDAVRKLREDPDFQRRTAEEIHLLLRRDPPNENPAG